MARMRIKDIAAEAGVSPATVSRVLNNRAGTMTDATRARVEEVIRRTGYRPSNAARTLRAGRSGTIGVVLADIRNPFSSAMLEALSTQAAGDGISLMTATSANDPAREEEAIEQLLAAGVDGLIVNTCGTPAEVLAAASRRAPVVLLDRDVPGSGLPLVTSNNAELVSGLVEELQRAGCTRCVMLDESDTTSLIRRARCAAFTGELIRRGLEGHVEALADEETTAAAAVRALVDGPGPVGLVAVNGLVFLRLVSALGTVGLSMPNDVRIATFDEYAWNRVLFGGITTAVQDTEGIAAAVLALLAAGAGARPSRTEVPGRIIARASTR